MVLPIIELENVNYEVNGAPVLHNVSLRIEAHRAAIIGANGSGKSTVLRLIAGLIAPSSGQVRIDGIDPFRDRKEVLSRLGMIFQNPDHQIIFPTVGEELAFGLRQQSISKQDANDRARAFLNRAGRADWFERPVNHLSQGERHLVCLMAVLLMEPRTILFDEPYAGLDLSVQLQLHRNLERLDAQAVLVSHEDFALQGVEHVIWLQEGRVLREGGCELLDDYREAMTAKAANDAELDLTL